jgi:hypothetical protein
MPLDLQYRIVDKHGLVNRFSQVLEQNGINHMYSSTFKTANILVSMPHTRGGCRSDPPKVDKKHAKRAQSLLRSC